MIHPYSCLQSPVRQAPSVIDHLEQKRCGHLSGSGRMSSEWLPAAVRCGHLSGVSSGEFKYPDPTELGCAGETAGDRTNGGRIKRIAADTEAMDRLLVDTLLGSCDNPPSSGWIWTPPRKPGDGALRPASCWPERSIPMSDDPPFLGDRAGVSSMVCQGGCFLGRPHIQSISMMHSGFQLKAMKCLLRRQEHTDPKKAPDLTFSAESHRILYIIDF